MYLCFLNLIILVKLSPVICTEKSAQGSCWACFLCALICTSFGTEAPALMLPVAINFYGWRRNQMFRLCFPSVQRAGDVRRWGLTSWKYFVCEIREKFISSVASEREVKAAKHFRAYLAQVSSPVPWDPFFFLHFSLFWSFCVAGSGYPQSS